MEQDVKTKKKKKNSHDLFLPIDVTYLDNFLRMA